MTLDMVFGVIALVVGIVYLVLVPSEAARVRDGNPPTQWWRTLVMRRAKDDQRTPEEFATKYRSILTRNARIWLVVGVLMLVLAVALMPFGGRLEWWQLFVGAMFLALALGNLRARRALDAPGPG